MSGRMILLENVPRPSPVFLYTEGRRGSAETENVGLQNFRPCDSDNAGSGSLRWFDRMGVNLRLRFCNIECMILDRYVTIFWRLLDRDG
jgi:hypothetical protein